MGSLLEKSSDNELYDLFLKGRQEAMRIIVQRNSPKLFNFMYRMVPDAATCEELVQEVFLKLVRARPDFSSGTKVSTYLFSVARNLAIDEIRRQKHRRHLSLDQYSGGRMTAGRSRTSCPTARRRRTAGPSAASFA